LAGSYRQNRSTDRQSKPEHFHFWTKELDYRLIREPWAFCGRSNRRALCFAEPLQTTEYVCQTRKLRSSQAIGAGLVEAFQKKGHNVVATSLNASRSLTASPNLDNRTLPRLTQNRQCTHLSFVQIQHYRVALESRAIRKLKHKSETVRIRLPRLEAFMRWVVCFWAKRLFGDGEV
jgi:hypothetical protein